MRDYRQLRVFQDAHQLVKQVYRVTKSFPIEERFGLTSQLQRSVVSIASNIVEGSSRSSTKEYRRFLEIAYASSCEASYQLFLAKELELSSIEPELEDRADHVSKQLARLIQSLEPPGASRKPQADSPEGSPE